MDKRRIAVNFPLSLALFDAFPVLFFCCAVLVIGMRYQDPLYSMVREIEKCRGQCAVEGK